jgi:hypothetical protein
MSADYDQYTTQTFPGIIIGIDIQSSTVNFVTLTYGGVTQQQAVTDVSKSLNSQGFRTVSTTNNTEYDYEYYGQPAYPGATIPATKVPYILYKTIYSVPKSVSHCPNVYLQYKSNQQGSVEVGCQDD